MSQLALARPADEALTSRNSKFVRAGLFLWGLAAFGIISVLLLNADVSDSEAKLYLIPWCLTTAMVVLIPSVYLFHKGRFDPFHPLVFAAWSYFLPGFVIGGLLLAFGISKPYFLSYVENERFNLPLTLVYVMLGYGGMSLGYAIPYAKRVGRWVSSKLPGFTWSNQSVRTPGFLLLGLGATFSILALSLGRLGYQYRDRSTDFDTLINMSSSVLFVAIFLLWLYIFRTPRRTASHYLISAILIVGSLAFAAFLGNRGGFLRMLLLVGFAYALSRRRFSNKQCVLGAILLSVTLVAGMIYGTTFRSIKQPHQQAGVVEMADYVGLTAERLLEEDLSTSFSTGMQALGERIDSVSSLAVVVANYEAFAPYEESWGISNNILTEFAVMLIPRFVWPDKPIVTNPQTYAELYFNFGDSAFAMTPMGDLLRNFGPLGVPVGMIALGFFIRVLYAGLVDGQEFSHWRAVMFYVLFSSISFEGPYGQIFPFILRVGFFALLAVLLVQFYMYATRRAHEK